jgi:hypothetical protein
VPDLGEPELQLRQDRLRVLEHEKDPAGGERLAGGVEQVVPDGLGQGREGQAGDDDIGFPAEGFEVSPDPLGRLSGSRRATASARAPSTS